MPEGRIVYTQMLNARGGIECDLTVTRLSESAYLLVTPAPRCGEIRRGCDGTARGWVAIVDVTAAEAVFPSDGAVGARPSGPCIAGRFLEPAHPFGHAAREIEIGMGLARAHRVTYVGELGWEIYVPTDQAAHVFEALVEAGADRGLKLCGIHAMNSCRLEKAFRHFGHDITDEDHVLEAGLGFAVKTDKGDFIGRDAVLRKREAGVDRRLMQFRLTEPEFHLHHNEPVLRDGKIVGYLTSGAYGHALGAAIGLGYVPCNRRGERPEEMLNADYAVEIAGRRVATDVSLRAMYDPKSERVKT